MRSDNFNLVPLCLPTPDTFENNIEMSVTMAGRGKRRYSQFEGRDHSSCQTNEVLAKSKRTSSNVRQNFLPCNKIKILKKTKIFNNTFTAYQYCYDIPSAINSFSSETKLNFKQGMKIKPSENDKCEEYWKKAGEAYNKYIDETGFRMADFQERADRIIIHKHGTTITSENQMKGEICYNVKKVGRHGICQTNRKKPYNWSFCSKACVQANLVVDAPSKNPEAYQEYDSMRAIYFEEPPKEDPLSGNKIEPDFEIGRTLVLISSPDPII